MRMNKLYIPLLLLAGGLNDADAQTYSNRASAATRSAFATSGGTNNVGYTGANYAPRIGEYQSRGTTLIMPVWMAGSTSAVSRGTGV